MAEPSWSILSRSPERRAAAVEYGRRVDELRREEEAEELRRIGEMPYEVTEPEILGPQDLVNAYVRSLMQKRVTEAEEAEDARRTEIEYQKRKIKQGTAPRPDGSVLSGLDILRHAFKNDEEAKRMAKVALGAAGLGAGIAAPLLIPSAPILSGAVINALTGIPMNYLFNAPEGVVQDAIAGAIAGAVVPKYGMAAALPAMLASYAATATPEAEAGSIKGVKSLVNKKLWPLVDRLFSEAPGSAAFTDEMLAKAINSGERILPMRAGNFRSATFEPMFYTSDDPEYVKLLDAAKSGALKNMPWLEVDRNRIGGHIIPFISGHDGRHRLQAVESVFGDVNSPVIIQPNKHIKTIKKDVYLPQAAYEDVGVVDVGELYNYNDGFSLGIDPGKFIKGPKGPGLEYTDKGEWVEKLRAEKAQGGPVKMSQGGRMLSLLRGKGALPAYTEGATYGRSILPTSVVKQKGGNWLSGSVEGALSGLKKPPQSVGHIVIPKGQEAAWPRGQWLECDNNGVPTLMRISETGAAETIPLGTQQVNNWIEGPLTKYIKNQMATPEDPLRLMADAWPEKKAGLQSEIQKRLDKAMADMEKARVARGFTPEMMTRSQARINELLKEKALIDAQDALHFDPNTTMLSEQQLAKLALRRPATGFPASGVGESELARQYENIADAQLTEALAKDWRKYADPKVLARISGIEKIPDEAFIYERTSPDMTQNLGLDHLIDELRNATNPASGLPRYLQIDPEDLGRMNVKDAAERVARINAYRAVQKAEADALLARNPATFDFKDYPDTDYKWVQLRQPQDVTLPTGYSLRPEESASSGKLMGYRVLNAEGKPIAWGDTEKEAIAKTSTALQDALKYEGDMMQTCVGGYCDDVLSGRSQIYSLRNKKTGEPYVTIEVSPESLQQARGLNRVQLENMFGEDIARDIYDEFIRSGANDLGALVASKGLLHPRILQIKGRKNLKPDDKFLPFVHQFIQFKPDGTPMKWSDVGDLHNTGLLRVADEPYWPKDADYGRIKDFSKAFPTPLKTFAEETGAGDYYDPKLFHEWLNRKGFASGGHVKMSQGGLAALARRANSGRLRLMRKAQEGVIKLPGGNWRSGSVEGALSGLKQPLGEAHNRAMFTEEMLTDPRIAAEVARRDKELAVNQWIEGPLTKYIKNRMGTTKDELRLMADAWPEKKTGLQSEIQKRLDKAMADMEKARIARGFTPEMMTRSQARINELLKEKALIDAQDALHFEPAGRIRDASPIMDKVIGRRVSAGFAPQEYASTPLGQQWERYADAFIRNIEARDLSPAERAATFGGKSGVPVDTVVHELNPFASGVGINDLGFGHLIDELRNATNPASGLPRDLLFDPEDIGRMNVKDAVERVARINAYRAVQKAEANAALARNPATFDFKDFPDTDYKWVQLKAGDLPKEIVEGNDTILRGPSGPIGFSGSSTDPRRAALADALKYEGDMMQTCVGGYCDNVLSGRSQIYSLRNKKTGEPYVTIEVAPPKVTADLSTFKHVRDMSQEEFEKAAARINSPIRTNKELAASSGWLYRDDVPYWVTEGDFAPRIVQIKGKHNRKPDDKFLPFVHQFIQFKPDGTPMKWSGVGDLQNTGLRRFVDAFNSNELEKIQAAGIEVPFYATPQEIQEIGKKVWPESWESIIPVDYAYGGHVKTNSPEVSAAGYNSASWNILGEAA